MAIAICDAELHVPNWLQLNEGEKQCAVEEARICFRKIGPYEISRRLNSNPLLIPIRRSTCKQILNKVWHNVLAAKLFEQHRTEEDLQLAVRRLGEEIEDTELDAISADLMSCGVSVWSCGLTVTADRGNNWQEHEDAQLDVEWAMHVLVADTQFPINFVVDIANELGLEGYDEEEVKADRAVAVLNGD